MDIAKQLAEAIRAIEVDCYCSFQGCGSNVPCQRDRHEDGKRLVKEALAAYDAEQELYVEDNTAQPISERKANVLDWLINNLLTDSQLDARPPGMSGALRFTYRRD